MRKNIIVTLSISILFLLNNCKFKKDRNMVPVEQITIDESTNYRHVFKKAINEEKKRDNRYKKNEFKD